MKLSKGRGIKFFRHPSFNISKGFIENTLASSKKHLSSVLNTLPRFKSKK